MSRISSQGSIIMISDDIDAASAPITAATKAKPCVLTSTTGAVVGDIVVPRGTGWNSIDDMPFKVSAVAAGAITLEDSDTSDEVNDAAADATLSAPTFLELCRSNFTANNPAGATIDVTTLCDTAHRIVAGLPAIGTWNAAGFYDCSDVALQRARDCYRSGEDCIIDVRLSDGCGWTFAAIVNTFDVTLGVNAAVTNALGGQIDGLVHFYKTPAPGFVSRSRNARAPSGRRPIPARGRPVSRSAPRSWHDRPRTVERAAGHVRGLQPENRSPRHRRLPARRSGGHVRDARALAALRRRWRAGVCFGR